IRATGQESSTKPENVEECALPDAVSKPVLSIVRPETRAWPKDVEAGKGAIDIRVVREDNTRTSYVYCSQNFQFVAPSTINKDVLTDLARVAEGTRSLVRALPWGVEPHAPPGSFHAKLYDTRGEYAADLQSGSRPDAAPSYAVYDSGEKIIRIPLNYVAERRDGALVMVRSVETHPVVHEVTHQMMHDYLQFLPHWVAEGTAEYAAMLPYRGGVFSADAYEAGLKEYLKTQGRDTKLSDLDRIDSLIRMTPEEWNARAVKGGVEQRRLYISSLLLVYYFSHLDGDPKGDRIFKYFDRMAEARNAWVTFLNDPRVTLFPGGRILSRIPLPPYPETFGRDHLDILFNGRSGEELQKAFLDAYKKIGVK
ncbi:MAG TPA: hypothetical protein VFY29_16895, partial [Terriglobia bacterium]|nr:hypothetical protein [Terriglobia bacterium]